MNVTKKQAQQALNLVRRKYKGWFDQEANAPYLVENWDWTTSPAKWSIVWESGPFEWAIADSFAVTDAVKGVFAEPVTGWSLALYPDSTLAASN